MRQSVWSTATERSTAAHQLVRESYASNTAKPAVQSRGQTRRACLLLGTLFLSLYLLTMGGHLDSPDEELMFQVTRSLAERGSLDVGNTFSPEGLSLTGVDGQTYVPYGPVSSALSVPFYVVGKGLAALLPPRYVEVIERAAVGLRDPVVSAVACMLVFMVGIELGYGIGVAILVTLAYGLATMVWPFSKYSWSEPVTGMWLLIAVFAAIRGARSRGGLWSAACALALGLAVGTKITTAVVAPLLLLYLWGAGHGSQMARLKRCLPFAAVVLVAIVGLALVNVTRFGNPLQTGYYLNGLFDLSHAMGIAGLLVSPSKSVFLYAPIAVLGLVGFVPLARRQRWEAALFGALFLSHVLVYGLATIWHGDAAWGPRYLLPVLPFIVLPSGATLEWASGRARTLAQAAFGLLFALGVVVNLGAVLVDQRVSFTYLLRQADGNLERMDAQRWDPTLSPVLIHWREIRDRTSIFREWWSQPVSLISGTYAKEAVAPENQPLVASTSLFPRWTSGSAEFELRSGGEPVRLTLEYLDNRPGSIGPANVQVYVDGAALPEDRIVSSDSAMPLPDGRRPHVIRATLDEAVTGRARSTIAIRSQPWQPSRDDPPSKDIRELGVLIWDARIESDGRDLPIAETPFSPMPVSDARPWSYELETWFYRPPHPADVWPWFLSLSGVPPWLIGSALAPLAGLIWSSWRVSQLRF